MDKNNKLALPSNITPEPQNNEQFHLELFRNSPRKDILTYIGVSDDYGNFYDNTELDQEVRNFISTDLGDTDLDLNQTLTDSILIGKNYFQIMDHNKKIAAGIETKSSILWGRLLIKQKQMLNNLEPRTKWINWFESHYNLISLRSAQGCMRLAKVPNIIRYAFLGKDRLLNIISSFNIELTDDPFSAEQADQDQIGDQLKYTDENFSISLDHESQDLVSSLKHQIDRNCTIQRIFKYAEEEGHEPLPVSSDLIQGIVRHLNKSLSNARVKSAYEAVDNGEDVETFFNRIIDNHTSRDSNTIFRRNSTDLNNTYTQTDLITSQILNSPVDGYNIDKDIITGLIAKLQTLLEIINQEKKEDNKLAVAI